MVTIKDSLKIRDNICSMIFDDKKIVLDSCIVGSSFINGRGNDCDILIYIPSLDYDEFIEYFKFKGYEVDGNEEYGNDDFVSMKSGHINVVMTQNLELYKDWEKAAHVCRYLNLMSPGIVDSRESRVDIHQIICDGRRMEYEDFKSQITEE